MNRSAHLECAYQYWKRALQPDDWVIDATCGNGKDTLRLSYLLQGENSGLIGIDLQSIAIEKTKTLLHSQLPSTLLKRIFLFCCSHDSFPYLAETQKIGLIVYNLGYLPGGNKALTTQRDTTRESLKKSLLFLRHFGMISITCYPGHFEGEKEREMLLQFTEDLDVRQWNVSHHYWSNLKAPSLHIIQKKFMNC